MKIRLSPLFLTLMMAVAPLALTGCLENYQFGDITRFTVHELAELEKARVQYCDINSSSLTRDAALIAIRSKVSDYPENGICTAPKITDYAEEKDSYFRVEKPYYDIRAGPRDPFLTTHLAL